MAKPMAGMRLRTPQLRTPTTPAVARRSRRRSQLWGGQCCRAAFGKRCRSVAELDECPAAYGGGCGHFANILPGTEGCKTPALDQRSQSHFSAGLVALRHDIPGGQEKAMRPEEVIASVEEREAEPNVNAQPSGVDVIV